MSDKLDTAWTGAVIRGVVTRSEARVLARPEPFLPDLSAARSSGRTTAGGAGWHAGQFDSAVAHGEREVVGQEALEAARTHAFEQGRQKGIQEGVAHAGAEARRLASEEGFASGRD